LIIWPPETDPSAAPADMTPMGEVLWDAVDGCDHVLIDAFGAALTVRQAAHRPNELAVEVELPHHCSTTVTVEIRYGDIA
jgi:hypothetical protein